jgi:hypothetical protein
MRAVEVARTANADRAKAFAERETAFALKEQADVNIERSKQALSAAQTRSAGDIEQIKRATRELENSKNQMPERNEQLNAVEMDSQRARGNLFRAQQVLMNIANQELENVLPEDLSPERIAELESQLAKARADIAEIEAFRTFLISERQDSLAKLTNAENAYDAAAAVADIAQQRVTTAEQDLRTDNAAAAVANQRAESADANLVDAESKASAARIAADKPNSPDAVRERNERRSKAATAAVIASEIAKAAQEAADLARKTARDLAETAATSASEAVQKTDIQQAITRGGAVAGAIGIAILLVQIFVSSMRYYARLAELYDAQADALLASGGNPVIAGEFMEKFSPLSITFGKTPTSIYEKALDTIGTVAGTAAKRGQG